MIHINPTENKVILSIQNLNVKFTLRGQVLSAIRGVSLDVHQGESIAIVGESGSGKSVFVKCAMGLLDANGYIESGSILYNGMDLATFKTDKDWLKIRGHEIAMVFQDPMTSLNPLKTIGQQIREAVELHQGLHGEAAYNAVLEVLTDVGISEPKRRYKQYPHEFSGGMRQRVVIAIALACSPELLIADEPTTALDVTIQAQILHLMRELKEKKNTSMIMITHDLGIVAETCDRVAVMYAGKIIEEGNLDEVFNHTLHPYTEGLFNSLPNIKNRKAKLQPIHGLMPDPTNLPKGCAFAPRCNYATDACRERRPEMTCYGGTHRAACLAYEDQNFHIERGK